jgi:hypothetical protein
MGEYPRNIGESQRQKERIHQSEVASLYTTSEESVAKRLWIKLRLSDFMFGKK